MNAPEQTTLPAIGEAFGGGFFAGRIIIDGKPYAIVRAPKPAGEHKDTAWAKNLVWIAGAQSWNDGLANTQAMATAGSPIAKWALRQVIADHTDWYIPAIDELELLYRAFKPTLESNWLYNRSGVNASVLPPTLPYTQDQPPQTCIEAFQEGNEEALDDVFYWSSTQHAGGNAYAWCQSFGDGYQGLSHKSRKYRVVLVRRVAI